MTDRPMNRRKGENIHAGVMVLVHDAPSECAIQRYEVSLKYLKCFSRYRADTK